MPQMTKEQRNEAIESIGTKLDPQSDLEKILIQGKLNRLTEEQLEGVAMLIEMFQLWRC